MQYFPKVVLLLVLSNVFMSFAWYAHLKQFSKNALWVAVLTSWAFAFFEYAFQVPANRIGFSECGLTLPQLKILQEAITLVIFIPFAIFYMQQPISLNFLWASMCIMGAVFFIFR
jgi:uncharacterized protein (DUF486 family)